MVYGNFVQIYSNFYTDRDECKVDSPCNEWATCSNTVGSYTCKCKEGYTGDGITCTGIDLGAFPFILG